MVKYFTFLHTEAAGKVACRGGTCNYEQPNWSSEDHLENLPADGQTAGEVCLTLNIQHCAHAIDRLRGKLSGTSLAFPTA